jgi:hypothetical protein
VRGRKSVVDTTKMAGRESLRVKNKWREDKGTCSAISLERYHSILFLYLSLSVVTLRRYISRVKYSAKYSGK